MMTGVTSPARRRVLLTGMSGTGKSTVTARLAAPGYPAVDADAPGYSAEIAAPEDKLTGLGPGRDWVWQEDAIRAVLDRPDPIIFLSGCSPNQGMFYPALTHIILLTASPALITQRLESRSNNPFGKDPEELARSLALQAEIEPLLRRSATHVIDTSAPLEDVVAEVPRVGGAT
ncbi:MAG: dephospho-CoA kinase [Chloroflexota bacterium]|nr:dephospho-CoA kinase [Chloroflexota bacterium]